MKGDFILEEFIKSVIESERRYSQLIQKRKELVEEGSKCDLMQEDILHELEFSKLSAVEMMKMTKRLIEVRKMRRNVKNEIALYSCILDSYKTGTTSNTLIERVEKVKYNDSCREYVPRILKDLKIGRRG